MWFFGVPLGTIVVGSLVTSVLLSTPEDQGGQAGAVGVALVFVAVTTILLFFLYSYRRTRLADLVNDARPSATVIPCYASGGLRQEATEAGAMATGLAWYLTTTLALTVLDDRVEVWVRGDREPRWAVMRAGMRIEVRGVLIGSNSQPGIRIADTRAAVSFVPHYARTGQGARLERALRDLGEDPARHLEM